MNTASLENNLFQLIVTATVCLVFIFAAIIVFVFQYQRKMTEKSGEIAKNKLENQKRLLESSMVTKEIEMKRISRELHDGVGSEINALRLIIHNADIQSEIKNELNDNCLIISNSIKSISEELMPATLEKLGLEVALDTLLKTIKKVSQLEIEMHFESHNPFYLNELETLSIYRIIQELLNNILKHNKPKKLTFDFNHSEKDLCLTITDDGIYFTPESVKDQKSIGHGLLNIESRLQLINASISYIENKPSGTIVNVTLKTNGQKS